MATYRCHISRVFTFIYYYVEWRQYTDGDLSEI